MNHTTGVGQELVNVHEPWRCWGRWCAVHTPMPGPWRSWPTSWREDQGFMERVCPCGVGHPAVEDLLYFGGIIGTHGCCGRHRCTPTQAEVMSVPFIEGEIVQDRRELES